MDRKDNLSRKRGYPQPDAGDLYTQSQQRMKKLASNGFLAHNHEFHHLSTLPTVNMNDAERGESVNNNWLLPSPRETEYSHSLHEEADQWFPCCHGYGKLNQLEHSYLPQWTSTSQASLTASGYTPKTSSRSSSCSHSAILSTEKPSVLDYVYTPEGNLTPATCTNVQDTDFDSVSLNFDYFKVLKKIFGYLIVKYIKKCGHFKNFDSFLKL